MASQPAGVVRRPLRRTEYDRLVEFGVFDDEHIELLDGELVEMSPEGAPHTWVIQELIRLLVPALPGHLRLRAGNPWIANDISEPEPDIAIVPVGDYRRQHAASAVLLIEVAHSSRAKDLGIKARLYAAAGVPTYWVIDLVHEVVHVHDDPHDDGYATVTAEPFDVALDAAGIPVRIADILADPT